MTSSAPGAIDQRDAALIELLTAQPRVGVLEASRRLGVARGTVQARLDRLYTRGIITGYGPDIDPAALGYSVMAFVTLEISQIGGHDPVAERLAAVAQGLEAHTLPRPRAMLCRGGARSQPPPPRGIAPPFPPPPVLSPPPLVPPPTPPP